MYYSASSKASKKTKAEKYDQVEIPEVDKISLSDSQMTVLEAILARKSVFFTGAAGGKSFGVNLSMNSVYHNVLVLLFTAVGIPHTTSIESNMLVILALSDDLCL